MLVHPHQMNARFWCELPYYPPGDWPWNKSSWDEGPWRDEPDGGVWRDRQTGLLCMILRNVEAGGHLCGYVGVERGHALYDMGQETAAQLFECHGGITRTVRYPEAITHDKSLNCVWWIGFDAGHGHDFKPGDMFKIASRFIKQRYRDWNYMTEQVMSLSTQMSAYEVLKAIETQGKVSP